MCGGGGGGNVKRCILTLFETMFLYFNSLIDFIFCTIQRFTRTSMPRYAPGNVPTRQTSVIVSPKKKCADSPHVSACEIPVETISTSVMTDYTEASRYLHLRAPLFRCVLRLRILGFRQSY